MVYVTIEELRFDDDPKNDGQGQRNRATNECEVTCSLKVSACKAVCFCAPSNTSSIAAAFQQPDQQPRSTRSHSSHRQRRDRAIGISLESTLATRHPLLDHTEHQQDYTGDNHRQEQGPASLLDKHVRQQRDDSADKVTQADGERRDVQTRGADGFQTFAELEEEGC